MLRRYRLAALLLTLSLGLGACNDAEPTENLDHLTCENFDQEFADFLDANNHCEVDADCDSRQATPNGQCECNPAPGGYNTFAYRSESHDQVNAHLSAFYREGCDADATVTCDEGPISRTYCNEQGRCSVETDSGCLEL